MSTSCVPYLFTLGAHSSCLPSFTAIHRPKADPSSVLPALLCLCSASRAYWCVCDSQTVFLGVVVCLCAVVSSVYILYLLLVLLLLLLLCGCQRACPAVACACRAVKAAVSVRVCMCAPLSACGYAPPTPQMWACTCWHMVRCVAHVL